MCLLLQGALTYVGEEGKEVCMRQDGVCVCVCVCVCVLQLEVKAFLCTTQMIYFNQRNLKSLKEKRGHFALNCDKLPTHTHHPCHPRDSTTVYTDICYIQYR